jgi:hypothetical protein
MVLSRGLVISLGVSALGCTLLFLYFRNKISAVEKKVDVMFDLIQNHQQQQMNMQETMHMNSQQEFEETDNMQSQQETGAWTHEVNSQPDLIQVSDDEEDEDNDSEEVSDSDSDEEEEEEEIPKLSLAKTDNISLTENDIKKISVKETPVIDDTIELEEVDSLDEIDDDDDDDNDDDNNSETETPDKDIKKISVTKNDTEENIENNEDDNEVEQEEDNDDVDYTQLKVSELKAIAEAKGLTNYKSLKKNPLIELIKSSE